MLSNGKEVVLRRALLCWEGVHDGVYGPVNVSAPLLQLMAQFNNEQRAKPMNEFDYAPILVDHYRSADLCKGRLMAGLGDLALEVGKWTTDKGIEVAALYGWLRVDDEEAQKKVEDGVYAQLSLSFDDEGGEIFEVSFVAVEAARRAQLLAKGDSMNLEDMKKKLAELSQAHDVLAQSNTALAQSHDALKARGVELKAIRSAGHKALAAHVEQQINETAGVIAELSKGIAAVKTATLRAQFRGFVRLGKLPKAEFDGLKFDELAGLTKPALSAVLAAYESRPVSTDFVTHGQANAEPVALNKSSPEYVRQLMKAQKEGKPAPAPTPALAAGDEGESEEDKKKREEAAAAAAAGGNEQDPEKKDSGSEMKFEDIDDAVKCFEAIPGMIEKLTAYGKQMSDQLKKLMEQDDKEGEEK